jgi:pimeloyl-ACP methyl ester carboxylesterase
MWKNFPETVARSTGCSALVYSRYGNGFSEVLREGRAVSYMHDEARGALPQILDTFGIRDAILIGHSDGASIAFIYAGEVRDRVRALVAQAPHVFVEDLSIKTIAQARVLYETTDLRARLRRYHQDVDRTFYGWNDIWLNPDFRGWNIREHVRAIRVPVLLIQGSDDEYGSSAQLEAIRQDAAASVDTLYLANCGHAPHLARSDIVTSTIAAFVRSVQL